MSGDNALTQFRGQLVAMTPELANALPSHIKPEKFQRVVMTVVQLQPELLKSDRRSLFASCIKCAADGLIPDGREAALVVFSGKIQYMPMFTGLQKRVRNSGEITSIQAHVIYENDEFAWRQGIESGVDHKPKFPGDRGRAIGAYAIAKFKDGSDPQIEVMDIAQIERVRAVSRAAKNGPWVQWWDEMARKTVFRRLSKWLPLDAETDTIMRRDDEAGSPTVEAPAGPLLEGEAAVPDSFEQAASGISEEEGTALPTQAKGMRLDTDGNSYNSNPNYQEAVENAPEHEPVSEVAVFRERLDTMSLQQLQRLDTNAEHKAWLKGLTPPDYADAAEAITGRLQALRGGGG